ncbi:MAG TPA: hypothetical protein VK639_18885, partial [Terriglobales bacterium]|nr:hypothetical protein [Terriglobales bacterium]
DSLTVCFVEDQPAAVDSRTTKYVSKIIPITKTTPNSLSTCHMLASDERLLATGIDAGLGD